MAVRYYLGVDQGTTGTTALLLDENLAVRGRGYRELRQYYPRPGWVEHDPVEIWESVLDAARQAMEQAGTRADEISCVGLDHQGETCLIWDKKQENQSIRPLYGRTAEPRKMRTGWRKNMEQ